MAREEAKMPKVQLDNRLPAEVGIPLKDAPDGLLLLARGLTEVTATVWEKLRALPQVVALVKAGLLVPSRAVEV